jgi:hypothetical protein
MPIDWLIFAGVYLLQVKNCWEMQQYDCHGEKQKKKTQPPHKKTTKKNS